MERLDYSQEKNLNPKKILLVLLPFWTPLIPPMGIVSLKTFLQKHGYRVKTVDATVEEEFQDLYHKYFDALKKYIPLNKRGNFYNVGHDVLQNHMMAHFNHVNERKYVELVKLVIYQTYYCHPEDQQVDELNEIVSHIFTTLEKYFLCLLNEEKPRVVGLTAYHHNLPASLFVFRLCKVHDPTIMTVMGGGVFSETLPHGSEDLEIFLEKTKPYLDKIVIGEGQNLFLKLLRGELLESQRVFTIKDINNETLDISTIVVPDLSDMDIARYPYLAGSGSRSCPHNCSFCSVSVYYGKYKKKSAAQTVAEMKLLYEKYGQQLFFMLDSLLNPIITDISNEIIKENLPIYLDCYLRISESLGDIENTILWRRGGIYRTRIGIESGSQQVLDLMNKNVKVEHSKSALASLAYSGIKTTAYMLIGHPGETEADFQQTLDFIEELKDDIYEAECNPFCYFSKGQWYSGKWAEKRRLLYPEEATDMLISQSWTLDCYPPREEVYKRMNRFVQHCSKLGIPNPYSMAEIIKADERWKKLHKNAVSTMEEIISSQNRGIPFIEKASVNEMYIARNSLLDVENFSF